MTLETETYDLEPEVEYVPVPRPMKPHQAEGRAAYLCARPFTSCPYEFGTGEQMDWELGFVEAAQIGLPKYN